MQDTWPGIKCREKFVSQSDDSNPPRMSNAESYLAAPHGGPEVFAGYQSHLLSPDPRCGPWPQPHLLAHLTREEAGVASQLALQEAGVCAPGDLYDVPLHQGEVGGVRGVWEALHGHHRHPGQQDHSLGGRGGRAAPTPAVGGRAHARAEAEDVAVEIRGHRQRGRQSGGRVQVLLLLTSGGAPRPGWCLWYRAPWGEGGQRAVREGGGGGLEQVPGGGQGRLHPPECVILARAVRHRPEGIKWDEAWDQSERMTWQSYLDKGAAETRLLGLYFGTSLHGTEIIKVCFINGKGDIMIMPSSQLFFRTKLRSQ